MDSKLSAGKIALSLFLMFGLTAASSYLLIMDASTSMDDSLPSGESRIDAAKAAAISFIDASQGNEFAVMKFNYCNDGGDPEEGTIRVIQPLTSDKSRLASKINGISTDSWTPLAEAIAEGRTYIQQNWQGQGKIIVLTDGKENCGGDPVAEAKLARDQGIAVIDVISYAMGTSQDDIDAKAEHQQIAVAGGGKYYTADDEAQLADAFRKIREEDSSSSCCLPIFIFPALLLGGLYVRYRAG